jgi:putative transposase
MLVLSCDEVPTRPLEPTRAAVDIDVGIASFATTSDGRQVPNPGYERVAAATLATAQQVLARKQRGSNNRRRAKETLAGRHRKVTNQRRNFHHHAARALVARYDVDARHTSDRCEACGHAAKENRASQAVFSC